ncbi:haloacid dehalogenase type II [Mycolicibacterium baixiangningiae]|uniref:haloacid dehalogenase type II n=1 Tax=Mycolicibacterium baixiangningiae TaxID=2761578 RepID=UPI001867530B|nr:haloacid dehalogenase type II [Mycolicibacterium baixiangningiae]
MTVALFDVNETLLDIDSLTSVFVDSFDDPAVMREWFGQLVTYSMTVTLSRCYVDFFTLGRAVLQMVADIRGVTVGDAELDRLGVAMASMPAHSDVVEGLSALREHGWRLVSLTNSPVGPDGFSALDRAGLGEYFERQFSVDAVRAFKPDPSVYQQVCRELDVMPAQCTMVAAHMWDTIGAQATGMRGALIIRPGNAVLNAGELPRPDVVATDLLDLARQLGAGHSTQGVQP